MSSSSSEKCKVALITGVTGQDGSYLSELLLGKGYMVYGIIRRSSSFNTKRVDHLYKDPHYDTKFKLLYGDMTDYGCIVSILTKTKPDEIYNLAAQSHVHVSFQLPEYTANVDAMGTLRLLEAIRTCGLEKTTKLYQASTSELYGKQEPGVLQNEHTPFYPRSPYAVAKLYSYWIVINYREAYGIHGTNGILFNHESERRGETFVTRKITIAASKIKLGLENCLFLGNLDSKRDWGHAKDYVEAMWLMLQQEKPDDYVVATGETHSVREFCEKAFGYLDIMIEWRGERGTPNEYGVDAATGKTIVKVDEKYFRPTEVAFLWGDPSKAEKTLGWKRHHSFDELVKGMVTSDYSLLSKKVSATSSSQ